MTIIMRNEEDGKRDISFLISGGRWGKSQQPSINQQEMANC